MSSFFPSLSFAILKARGLLSLACMQLPVFSGIGVLQSKDPLKYQSTLQKQHLQVYSAVYAYDRLDRSCAHLDNYIGILNNHEKL